MIFISSAGGQATNADGTVIKLNKKVLAPKYYWKAVCDPSINASVVFVAQNPIGNINATPTKGCNNLMQSPKLGVIQCFSLNEAASSTGQFSSDNFVLPPFHSVNCDPTKRGTFMDSQLAFK